MSENNLRAALADYLAVRRCLGFQLTRDGLLLEQFVGFCEHAGDRPGHQLAGAGLGEPLPGEGVSIVAGYAPVRGSGFAQWPQADPATELPPPDGRRRGGGPPTCIPRRTSPR